MSLTILFLTEVDSEACCKIIEKLGYEFHAKKWTEGGDSFSKMRLGMVAWAKRSKIPKSTIDLLYDFDFAFGIPCAEEKNASSIKMITMNYTGTCLIFDGYTISKHGFPL